VYKGVLLLSIDSSIEENKVDKNASLLNVFFICSESYLKNNEVKSFLFDFVLSILKFTKEWDEVYTLYLILLI